MMNKYNNLTKFIPLLEDKNTRWTFDENAYDFYDSYTAIGRELIQSILDFKQSIETSYKIIKKNGYVNGFSEIKNLEIEGCDEEIAFAYLNLIFNCEKYVSGTIYLCIKNGEVLKLLKIIERNINVEKIGSNSHTWTKLDY